MSVRFNHIWKSNRNFKTSNIVAVRIGKIIETSDFWRKERENPAVDISWPHHHHMWTWLAHWQVSSSKLCTLLLSLACCETRMNHMRRRCMGTKDIAFSPGTPGFASPVAQRASYFLHLWAMLRNSWACHFAVRLRVPDFCRSQFQYTRPAPGYALCPTRSSLHC